MKALSVDLRQRIVDALQNGQSPTQVAQRFCVSVSSVGRLKRQWRQEGHLKTRPITGRNRAISDEQDKQRLLRLIEQQQDPTIESLSDAFEQETGRHISRSALHRNLHWLGHSFKKRVALQKSEMRSSEQASEQR